MTDAFSFLANKYLWYASFVIFIFVTYYRYLPAASDNFFNAIKIGNTLIVGLAGDRTWSDRADRICFSDCTIHYEYICRNRKKERKEEESDNFLCFLRGMSNGVVGPENFRSRISIIFLATFLLIWSWRLHTTLPKTKIFALYIFHSICKLYCTICECSIPLHIEQNRAKRS
jgi:hypothetical protein